MFYRSSVRNSKGRFVKGNPYRLTSLQGRFGTRVINPMNHSISMAWYRYNAAQNRAAGIK